MEPYGWQDEAVKLWREIARVHADHSIPTECPVCSHWKERIDYPDGKDAAPEQTVWMEKVLCLPASHSVEDWVCAFMGWQRRTNKGERCTRTT